MAAWDLSTATLASTFSVTANANIPGDLAFKPDGSEMYVLGTTEKDVVHYSLSTAWDITSASLTSATDLALNGLNGIAFPSDGTQMFVIDNASDKVYEYALSTAWDPSSASLTSSLDVSTEDGQGTGLFFKPDGTVMYLAGATNLDIFRYNLSTAWDITSASHVATYSTGEAGLGSLFFKPDGTVFYVSNASNDTVRGYSMSTAWDITTASVASGFVDVSTQTSAPTGAFFKPDGTAVFVSGFDGSVVGKVWRYDMAPAVVRPTVGFIGR